MRAFLNRITSLTPIAAGAAAGMIVLGIVAIVGGSYAHEVVHNQLGPQKITFPKPAEYAQPEAIRRAAGTHRHPGESVRRRSDRP